MRDEQSTPRQGRFTPWKMHGNYCSWVGHRTGMDRFGEGKFPARTGVSTQDRPARSKSLYRLSYPNTYVLTPCSRVLLEKLTGPQLVKKFPAFYATQRFITAIHKLLPPVSTLGQINPVHSSSFFLKFHFKIIPHLHQGLPNGVFPSGLPCMHLSHLPYVLHVSPISLFLWHMRSANKIFVYLDALSLQTYENSLVRQFCFVDSANDNNTLTF